MDSADLGVSLLLVGMFASWFVARQDQTVGALHDITVWGLSASRCGLCRRWA